MISNYEIIRYYWKEFSYQRLILAPIVLLVIFFLLQNITGSHDHFRNLILNLFWLVVIWYGSYKVSTSLTEDFINNTWDNQRLSSISPRALIIGKLFGPTLYLWYCGSIILIYYILVTPLNDDFFNIFYNIFVSLGVAFSAHSISLILTFNSYKNRKKTIVAPFIYAFIAIMISSLIVGNSLLAKALKLHLAESDVFEAPIAAADILYFIIFTCVTILGLYRVVLKELKFRITPVVWVLFCIFMIYYSYDMTNNYFIKYISNKYNYMPFITSLFLAYCIILFDSLDLSSYRKMLHYWKLKNYRRVLESTPMWIPSIIIVIIIAIISRSMGSMGLIIAPGLSIITSILFFIRDVSIVHYFTLARNNKRGLVVPVFYIILLYSLVPNIVFAVTSSKVLVPVFYPIPGDYIFLMIAPVSIQVILALYFVRKRWKSEIAKIAGN